MKHGRSVRFSNRVFACILSVSVLATLVVTVFAYFRERDMTLRYVRQSVSEELGWTCATIDRTLELTENLFSELQADSSLFSLIKGYRTDNVSPASATRIFQTIVNNHLPYNTDICDVQLFRSDVVMYRKNVTYTNLKNYSQAAFVRNALQTDDSEWVSTYDFVQAYRHTEMEGVEMDNQYLISLVGKLNLYSLDSSRLEYLPTSVEKPVLVISIPETYFFEVLPISEYENAKSLIIDDDGYVVTGTERMLRMSVLEENMLELFQNTDDDGEMMNLSGENMLIFSKTLSNGWRVVTLVAYNSVWQKIAYGLFLPLILVLGVLVAVCIGISFSVSKMLAKPILQLTNAISQNEQGNFEVRLPETNDEFSMVMKSYNRMSHRITELMEENYQARCHERENEMLALRYQTNPHFLYNALNIIYMTALKESGDDTARLIQHLAHVMRYVIRDHRDVVPLSMEIENVREYFTLINTGYENVLRLEIDVDEQALVGMLPKLSIQPLVENAVLHGLSENPNNGIIRICGYERDSFLNISIEDNGTGMHDHSDANPTNGHGAIGIANVRKRLQLLFGTESSLTLSVSQLGGVKVALRLPWSTEECINI